ncbi:MAG: peptidoglycan editing factor PgeF [Rhodocyclaceae bacterium]|jgi:YfiH family protein|nr:peptidoglycan editing factor PgeF [Rhodocyclaceae bacterium]
MSGAAATPLVLVPDWAAPARVHALFTTRQGGCSVPPWDSLNPATHVGDDPVTVERNRALLRRMLPAAPHWLEQVHGTLAVDLDAMDPAVVPAADAAYTRVAGRVCAVMTADCLPVLLCDRAGTVVAAVHAGWRGLAAGVIERTVVAMARPGAELLAWLGPAIGPAQFEVGDEVRAAFVAQDAAAAAAFVPAATSGKWLADLFLLARQRLTALGVGEISGGGLCTVSDRERFFSYRRDGTCGRMAALIWLQEPER